MKRKALLARWNGRRWRSVVSGVLAAALAAGLFSARPGLTLERGTLCGQEAHSHTAECYEMRLVCALEEPEHTHGDGCYTQALACHLEEHAHGAECYGEEPTEEPIEDAAPTPGEAPAPAPDGAQEPEPGEEQDPMPNEDRDPAPDGAQEPEPGDEQDPVPDEVQDGVPGEEQDPAPEALPLQTGTWPARVYTDGSYGEMLADAPVITLTGALPEGAEIRAYPVPAEVPGREVLLAYDVTVFLPDGGVYEPAEPVEVYVAAPELAENGGDCGVFYVPEAGEPQPVAAEAAEGGVAFLAEHFSVYAVAAEISFRVEYWADLEQVAYNGGGTTLNVIDTSGGILPPNHAQPSLRTITVEDGAVKTQTVRTEIYTPDDYLYSQKLSALNTPAENLKNINKLSENENYRLKALMARQPGETEWQSYDPASVRFTNGAAGDEGTLAVRSGTEVRLVFDPAGGSYENKAAFYDYDISGGQGTDGAWLTGGAGINSRENYTDADAWDAASGVLAFGNGNCGTGLSASLFDDSYPNQASGASMGKDNYSGCTFGLAAGLGEDGTIQYAPGLGVPRLFQEGAAQGKHSYEESALTFRKSGDSYLLTAASGAGGIYADSLDRLGNPACGGKVYTNIWTNNFWPVDGVSERTDPLMGEYQNTGRFRGYAPRADGDASSPWTSRSGNLPVSDDGQAHNCFFGMRFGVQFDLSRDYIGPLDYLFFGDDDMWVFLTSLKTGESRLVCDIGGVHSSVGEYVNLWDYIPREGREGDEGYRLTFFYTERGASGSTCYMRFTLPSVSNATTDMATGDLTIRKTVVGPADAQGGQYTFLLTLAGTGDSYAYTRSGTEETGSIRSGDRFTLGHGESITIRGLPRGTAYTVEELTEGLVTAAAVNGVVTEGTAAAGVIVSGGNEVRYTNYTGPTLTLRKRLLGQWEGARTFRFRVEETDGAGTPRGDGVNNAYTVSLTPGEEGAEQVLTFGFRPNVLPGVYYYKVSEEIPPSGGDGIRYDGSYYIVAVTVAQGGLTAQVTSVAKFGPDGLPAEGYAWTEDGRLDFVNLAEGAGPRLPETGGAGLGPAYAAGAALSGGGALLLRCARRRGGKRM